MFTKVMAIPWNMKTGHMDMEYTEESQINMTVDTCIILLPQINGFKDIATMDVGNSFTFAKHLIESRIWANYAIL